MSQHQRQVWSCKTDHRSVVSMATQMLSCHISLAPIDTLLESHLLCSVGTVKFLVLWVRPCIVSFSIVLAIHISRIRPWDSILQTEIKTKRNEIGSLEKTSYLYLVIYMQFKIKGVMSEGFNIIGPSFLLPSQHFPSLAESQAQLGILKPERNSN